MVLSTLDKILAIAAIKGVSKQDIAKELGITPQSFNNRISRGNVEFRESELRKIAKALGVTVKVVFMDTPMNPEEGTGTATLFNEVR